MTSVPTKSLLLYGWPTPNARKVSTFLEELKAAYGVQYDVVGIDLAKRAQKEPEYIKLNPNGRVPTLVDRSRNNLVIFESAAILQYLQKHYDPKNRFGFDPETQPEEDSVLWQWILFTHGALGPAQGQAMFYSKLSPEKIPSVVTRFIEETKRVYGIFESRLTDRDWLVGPGKGVYTIADMNAIPWIEWHANCGIDSIDEWPNIKAWIARANARQAFKAGMDLVYIADTKHRARL